MARKSSTKKRTAAQSEFKGRVAFLVDDMFQDDELMVPRERLRDADYAVLLVGREEGITLVGEHGKKVVLDRTIGDIRAEEIDALVIPGGYSPDRLRTDERMTTFVREVFELGKPVAAVCHAGSLLIEAGIVDGRRLTSWPSIKTDLLNAGAQWIDREVVEDDNLITSRKPDDLDAFCDAVFRQLRGEHVTTTYEAPPPTVH